MKKLIQKLMWILVGGLFPAVDPLLRDAEYAYYRME